MFLFHLSSNNKRSLYTILVFFVLSSLDNMVIGSIPALVPILSNGLKISETSIEFAMAISVLSRTLSTIIWGYYSDRNNRKNLLISGTVIWSIATYSVGLVQSFPQFLALQLIVGIGLGCIASVGFSVIVDLVSPKRLGLALSLWGVTQGIGYGFGALSAAFLGVQDWRLPFFSIAIIGIVFAFFYIFSIEPRRGQSLPELQNMIAVDGGYSYKIQLQDIPSILRSRSNSYLIIQSFFVMMGHGALLWLPRLFIGRATEAGYSLEVATIVGNVFASILQTGVYFSILGGYLGDRRHEKDIRSRVTLSMYCLIISIPFRILFLFLPWKHLDLPNNIGYGGLTVAILLSVFENPWMFSAFLLSLLAVAFNSMEVPNRLALLNETNLPEHRGTIFSLTSLSGGLGLALGTALTSFLFNVFQESFPSPMNFALSLALSQLFFLMAALSYYPATKTISSDIKAVKDILVARSRS